MSTNSNRPIESLFESAALAVSEDLHRRVRAVFKGMLQVCYESEDSLANAVRESKLDEVFCSSCESYARLALAHRSALSDEPLLWVQGQVHRDVESILDLHFGLNRQSNLRPFDTGAEQWRARNHIKIAGLWNWNRTMNPIEEKIIDAMGVGLKRATVLIASGANTKRSPRPDGGAAGAEPSKGVREGKTVAALYTQLKTVRAMYRNNGWTLNQIRKETEIDHALLWGWVDRISDPARRKLFLQVEDWDDGDQFIFLQIATLYQNAPHLRRKPGWGTIRDWRKAYKGHIKHSTPDGRKQS